MDNERKTKVSEGSKKDKKIIFSTEIDSAINGYAIGISFSAIGTFLLLKPDYFFSPIFSYIAGAIMGLVGLLGIGVELSKSSKIKGLDNLVIGLIFLVIWAAIYIKVDRTWANLLSFLLLVIGGYAVTLGFLQGAYSIFQNIKSIKGQKNAGKSNIVSQIVLFLTQLCGLVLAIVNVLKALSV